GLDDAVAPADLARPPGVPLAQARLRRVRRRRAVPVLWSGPDRSRGRAQAGQGGPVLVTRAGQAGDPGAGPAPRRPGPAGPPPGPGAGQAGDRGAGRADEGQGRAGQPPGWLTRLAEAAGQMTVPAPMVPPPSGGRRSAVLILFADGAAGPDVLLVQRS